MNSHFAEFEKNLPWFFLLQVLCFLVTMDECANLIDLLCRNKREVAQKDFRVSLSVETHQDLCINFYLPKNVMSHLLGTLTVPSTRPRLDFLPNANLSVQFLLIRKGLNQPFISFLWLVPPAVWFDYYTLPKQTKQNRTVEFLLGLQEIYFDL